MSGPDVPYGHTGHARYDGWTDWYDAYLQQPAYSDVPAHVLRHVGVGAGICIDAGCGTGVHLETLASLGWSVIGLDVSACQLRLAIQRWPVVVQADVARMPFPDAFVARVVSVLTLCDFDDVEPFFREVDRILIPGGRLVVITTHPCFVGPFVKTPAGAREVVTIHAGYRNTQRLFAGPGIGDGIRSKVGVRHVPLAELLNKLVTSGLNVERVEEIGKATVPWLLALIAVKLG